MTVVTSHAVSLSASVTPHSRNPDALAGLRGYRVGLVVAHQHLGQLPPDVFHGVDANSRNKIYFTVSPDDARHLARHVLPVFDDYDLAHRRAFHATCRVVHEGQHQPSFSIAALPPLHPRPAALSPQFA